MWFSRDSIGTNLTVKRADGVTVGSKVWRGGINGAPASSFFVSEIKLVGDDVIFSSFGVEKFTTSIGNAVIVEVET